MAKHLHCSIANVENAQFRTIKVPWKNVTMNMNNASETSAFGAAEAAGRRLGSSTRRRSLRQSRGTSLKFPGAE
jgi:hypothetical protein